MPEQQSGHSYTVILLQSMHPQVKVGNHWAGHGNSVSAAQKLVNGPGKGSEATAVGPEKRPKVCMQDQIR